MAIYFNAATEKYPLSKLNILWDSLVLTDTINFSECIYTATADFIALFGVLDNNCAGIIKSKDKDWKPNSEAAALFVYAKEKDVWDNNVGKFVTQKVHKDENYLYLRLFEALEGLADDAKFSLSSQPLPNPTLQTLIDKNQPELYMDLMQQLLAPHLQIGAATTDLLTPEKTKPFLDAISKIGSGSGFNGNKSYKPAETEQQKLQARLTFVMAQMKPNFECATISELVYNITAIDDKAGLLALESIIRLMGAK